MKWDENKIRSSAKTYDEILREYDKPETMFMEELCSLSEMAEFENRFDAPPPDGLGVLNVDFWIVMDDNKYGIVY